MKVAELTSRQLTKLPITKLPITAAIASAFAALQFPALLSCFDGILSVIVMPTHPCMTYTTFELLLKGEDYVMTFVFISLQMLTCVYYS